LAASCNVPARPATCDTPTTFTLGDEAMLSIRVTPACWRVALVVAIVGITCRHKNMQIYPPPPGCVKRSQTIFLATMEVFFIIRS
jgi:hypothetical protein